MVKVRPWCGQPSDRGRLKNRSCLLFTVHPKHLIRLSNLKEHPCKCVILDARQSVTLARRATPLAVCVYSFSCCISACAKRPTLPYFSAMLPRHLANIAETQLLSFVAEHNFVARAKKMVAKATSVQRSKS